MLKYRRMDTFSRKKGRTFSLRYSVVKPRRCNAKRPPYCCYQYWDRKVGYPVPPPARVPSPTAGVLPNNLPLLMPPSLLSRASLFGPRPPMHQVPNLECYCVGITQSGGTIVSGWSDGKVRAFYPESGKLKFVLSDAHSEGVTAIALAHDDDTRPPWRCVIVPPSRQRISRR